MDKIKIVHQALIELLHSSTEIAFRDGQITSDEAALLESLGGHLINIETELLPVIDLIDVDLSQEEIIKRVNLIARDIIPTLTKLAEDDGIIVSDEAAILSRILNDVMSRNNNE
ncbi:MAG: hypothetical protein HeimC2_45270 [Candidatus Heimdallarchaeota archaeon LC_2]|nr:MAG: hypothetical protein HeimC2_45270 [Candidatus Heimdallarchaeota archaeon LC_2]